MSKTFRDSNLYRERLTESDLVRDFPADENFIKALHRMQAYFYARNSPYDIPVVRVMNNAHFVLNYMMNIDCTERMEYDVIVYRNSGKDKQLAAITIITLIAMLEYTDTARARTCYSVMTEDRSEEFYEGLSLYKQWLENPTEHFSEEDFHIDLMDEIVALRAKNEQLTYENKQLKKQYRDMENQYNQFNQYNAPVYQGCTINNNFYGQEPQTEQATNETESVNESDFFCRITKHAIDSGHAQEVEDELRSAAVSAPKLVKAIKTNEALGYLDTQNLTSQALYDMLNEHFGLKFGVRNFTIARNR